MVVGARLLGGTPRREHLTPCLLRLGLLSLDGGHACPLGGGHPLIGLLLLRACRDGASLLGFLCRPFSGIGRGRARGSLRVLIGLLRIHEQSVGQIAALLFESILGPALGSVGLGPERSGELWSVGGLRRAPCLGYAIFESTELGFLSGRPCRLSGLGFRGELEVRVLRGSGRNPPGQLCRLVRHGRFRGRWGGCDARPRSRRDLRRSRCWRRRLWSPEYGDEHDGGSRADSDSHGRAGAEAPPRSRHVGR